MECACRRASLCLLIYLSLNVANVFCHNIPLENISSEISALHQTGNMKREVTQTQSPTKAQLINALFSYASAKGLLPKTTQIIQSPPQGYLHTPTSQNAPITLNVVPLPSEVSSNCEKKPMVSSIPAVSINSIPNHISSPTISYAPSMLLPTTVKNEPVSWSFLPKITQTESSEDCTHANPFRTIWQIPQSSPNVIPVNSCTPDQLLVNEATPLTSLKISPSPCLLTPINTECRNVEKICETNFGTFSEASLLMPGNDKPSIPINLQINVPPPEEICPKITIVTATNPEQVSSFSSYMSPPPVIVKRSRSCLRKLLPIILLTLFDNCRCCSCNSDDPIPIPYPIPIPINNPIINA